MREYHRENKHKFLHKATGLAAVGGVVALALTKGAKPIGALLDRVATSEGAQSLAGMLYGGLRTALRSEDSFAEAYFSNEVRALKETAEIVDVGTTTYLQSQKRLDSFMQNLRPWVNEQEKFDTPEFQRMLRGHLSSVGVADRASELNRGLLSHEGIDALNESMQRMGVTTRFNNKNHQIDVIKQIVNFTDHRPSLQEVTGHLGKAGNESQVYRMLEETRDFHARRSGAVRARFTPKSRDILLGQISEGHRTFDQRMHAAVVAELSHRHGVDAESASKILKNAIESHTQAMAKVFPSGDHLRSALDMMMGSRSGFVFDEARNKAASLTRLSRAGSHFAEKALSTIQIPLTPYRFNIPLKFLNIMPRAGEMAMQIGAVGDQPELMRMASKGALRSNMWKDPTSRVIASGDRLMVVGEHGLEMAEGQFFVGDLKQSPMMRRVARVRSMGVNPYKETLFSFKQGAGYKTKAQKFLQTHSHRFSYLDVDPETGQFMVVPKSRLAAPLVRAMGVRPGDVDPGAMNPRSLIDLLGRLDPSMVSGEDYHRVMSSIIHEAGKVNINSQPFFQHFAQTQNLPAGFTIPGLTAGATDKPGALAERLIQLMRSDGSADAVMGILKTAMPREGGRNVFESSGALKRTISNQLYRAFTAINSAPHALGVSTVSDAGGAMGTLEQLMQGNMGVSTLQEKLHRGMFAQILHGLGVGQYEGYEALGQHLESLAAEAYSHKDFGETMRRLRGSSKFMQDLSKIGLHTPEQMFKALSYMVEATENGPRANYSRMGEVASLLLDKNQVLGLSPDNNVRAKLVDVVRETLEDSSLMDVHNKNFVLRNLMYSEHNGQEEEWLMDTVQKRFHALREAHGQDFGPNPLFNARYYAMPKNGPSAADFLLNPTQTIRQVFDTSARAGNFAKAFTDPTAAHGPASMLAHMISLMPQTVGENIGLGLPTQDQMSPMRATMGWWLKRVLPLTVGLELYKNINSNMHDMHMPGVDDMAANILANTNLAAAGIKDFLGVTSFAKHMVGALPGLDQYFHPRSHDEYKDYLFYGEEEVREGRGWFTGSRSAMAGGRIKYVRPNFFRRWHSHWTEADNVDMSNSAHSFLPNLMHPFAPISRFITDRDWFVHKHLSDRPYAKGGVGVGSAYAPDGNFLTSNDVGAYGGGVGGAIADVGGGFPTKMLGGGIPVDLVNGVGMGAGYGSGVGSSEPVHLELHQRMRGANVFSSLNNAIAGRVQNIRSQAGMFGVVMNKIPGFPQPHGIMPQNWKAAISNTRMMFGGEYGELTMSLGEFYRRIVHPADEGDYNPLPNNQGSWMPSRFRTGDPYIKTPGGYFNMPGDAYEKLNPWVAPLRVRGSAIGLSVEEILQKWINPTEPLGSGDAEDIVEFGSEANLRIQRQLNERGMLLSAETSIYDKKHNISGTIDAIIRGANGPEIVDIKTQGGKHWGETPDKYIDQITAYMAITGIHRAHLAFVNRDDPTMTRMESFDFDPQRWQKVLNKVETARSVAHKMVEKGMISPFETYDLLARIDVLSKVAPNSNEFQELVDYAETSGGFGGFERQRYHEALHRAKKLGEQYRLYPRLGIMTESHLIKVQDIGSNGEILTEDGTLRLAGVKFNEQAFGQESAEQVLGKFGIHKGKYAIVHSLKGAWDKDVRNDTETPVTFGHANRQLMVSPYASEDRESTHPMDQKAVGENIPVITRLWEAGVHLDNMFTNKFMRVRTAVEQLERGEVYGTDYFTWGDITGSLVKPTLASIASKNPLSGMLKGALVASLFVSDRVAKGRAMAIGGIVGASLSMARGWYETILGKTWKPKDVRKQEAFDEYWDTLEYAKYATMAEAAKKKAKKVEGVDLNTLENGEQREYGLQFGPWATLATYAERKARNTMYGYNEAEGTLQEALSVIPTRHRQLAESVITTGSIAEKKRFYDLISAPEKRVLAKFLGKDWESAPRKQEFSRYFRHHYLPEVDWAGWQENVNMDDLRVRAEDDEGLKVERPTRGRVERAKATTSFVKIPRMSHHTPLRIRRTLHSLMSHGNFSTVKAKYVIRPSNKSKVNVDFRLAHDQTEELIAEARNQLYMGEQQ